jgi:hydroxymethylglutaryl-CoA lyase
MEPIYITDVAPRDGLQNQAVHVGTADKLRLIECLVDAGLRSIEATSFVSPKAVPQMADAGDLLAGLAGLDAARDLRTSVLVPNMKGLERALAAGAREVAVVLSATETMNRKNINMSLAQAADVSEEVVRAAIEAGIQTRAYVAVAWECPFEGDTDLDEVLRLSQRMEAAGAHEVVLADTIGAASPGQVKQRLEVLTQALNRESLAVHFHDTRGMGVANAYAALEAGIRRFDASTGGIGGCPFAPGAAGNLATEDLVLMAERSGYSTGIDVLKLVEAVDLAQQLLGRELGGRSMPWLRRRIRAAEGAAARAVAEPASV